MSDNSKSSDGPDTPRPRGVARIWRGRTRREDADAYEAYNFEEGIRPLIAAAERVETFRRDGEVFADFMTISYWPDVGAMAKFAGSDDPKAIHHLPRDAEFLIELPEGVEILELRFECRG